MMEYILSLALLVLNLINYERDLGRVVFFATSAVIFVALFYFVHKKTKDFLATCLVVMCHTWQISWINVFGTSTSKLQLPWFYLLGAMIVMYTLFNIGKCMKKDYSAFLLIFFGIFLILINYPLIIADSFSEGIKEYIMIGFFVIVLLASYLFKDRISKDNYEYFRTAFIWAAVTSSVFLLFQYAMYVRFGIRLFKINLSQYFSRTQVSCHLLMGDHSCSTIMFGCAAFYIADRISKKKWYIYVPSLLVVLAAMAVTSRRTSTLTLIAVAAAYVLFHYRGFGKKLVFSVIFGAALAVMVYYLLIVRPVDNLSQAFSDNGRFRNYSSALSIIFNNPLGVGYGDAHLESLMAYGIVPHNTLLRWICMGSVVFAAPLVCIIYYVIRTARKKKLSSEFWAILYSVIASNFIPDIMNARFFIIPCAMVFLVKTFPDEETDTARTE